MNINNILTNFWSSIKSYLVSNYQPKGSYANSSHTHDDRYYTESEVNNLLGSKSDTSHNHNSTYLGISAKAESAKSADSVAWSNVYGKPSTFTPSSHTHDDRYYTESEIDTKLNGKSNTNHTHSNYLTSHQDISGKYNTSDLGSSTFKVTRGSSISTSTTGYWGAMVNSTSAGSPTLPSRGWWHVLSMDWSGEGSDNWISQLAIPTQDGNCLYWRRNNSGGIDISNSTWHLVIDDTNIGSQSVNYANHAGYVQGNNNSANAANALLRSGGGRNDSSPDGDTWIFWDELGGPDAPWGFKHNQWANTIGFYGLGTETSSINLSNGHFSGTVDWSRVVNRPTAISSFTNDSGYITSSGSCNYANSSGNADTVDGSHAWQMQTLNAGGGTHGPNDWLMHCQHNVDGDNYFKLYCGDKSIGTKVDRANSAGYADSAGWATNATYTNWLRASSHHDHLVHTEWDGGYFWTYVTAGDGGYRAVKVERSNSSGWADSAGSVSWGNVSDRPTAVSQFTNDSGYITSSGSCNYANSAGWANGSGRSDSSGYADTSGRVRTQSNTDWYINCNWDGSYFQTDCIADNGSRLPVNVNRADYAARSAGDGAFYISGYQIYVG